MSRKHGGLSRKDALKGRKGTKNKQKSHDIGQGYDRDPVALFVGDDGDVKV